MLITGDQPCERFSRSHLATHQPCILCLHVSGQSIHKFFQSSPIIRCQGCFQGMTKCTFQATFPTFTPVVQIGSSPGQFTGWVDLHSIRRPDNTNHLPLGQNFTTAHACPLRHVLYSLNRFLRHLHLKSLPVEVVNTQRHSNSTTNLLQAHHRHVYASFVRPLRRVLRPAPTRRSFSCPSCPSSCPRIHPLHQPEFGRSRAS